MIYRHIRTDQWFKGVCYFMYFSNESCNQWSADEWVSVSDALAVSQCNLHELMSGFTQMGMSQQCWLHVLARWARAEPPDMLWKCTLGRWETIATDHDFTLISRIFHLFVLYPYVSVESQAFLDDNRPDVSFILRFIHPHPLRLNRKG